MPDIEYWGRLVPATRLYVKYRDRSMIPYRQFVENLLIAAHITTVLDDDDAAIVECGTWQGGMAAALIEMCGTNKPYLFFDSFEGLPPAKEIDGESAIAWQADTGGANYHDNCRSSITTFYDTIRRSRVELKSVVVKKGFFEDTLADFASLEIQILRLDADWYDSTMICLERFWDSVVAGGVILIDDYYAWDGCSRAVHDFLAKTGASERIRQGKFGGVAYIVKE